MSTIVKKINPTRESTIRRFVKIKHDIVFELLFIFSNGACFGQQNLFSLEL
jgi:hypothetical protein